MNGVYTLSGIVCIKANAMILKVQCDYIECPHLQKIYTEALKSNRGILSVFSNGSKKMYDTHTYIKCEE